MNPLVGSNIRISSITAGSSTVTCSGCFLNFTTGNFLSQTTVGSNRTWFFDGGPQQLGQFTITGRVGAAGLTTDTTLLSGYFTAPTLSLTGIIGTTPRYRLFSGSLVDVKNTNLVDYFLGRAIPACTEIRSAATTFRTLSTTALRRNRFQFSQTHFRRGVSPTIM
jgi:hypothetical protein